MHDGCPMPVVRAMEHGDIPACEETWFDAWGALREAYGLRGGPPSDQDRARLRRRLAHLLRTDPGGSWVADEDGAVVGLAQALVRQDLWVLSLLGVAVSWQSQGVGRDLMGRAMTHGDPSSPGLIMSSRDPRAMRRYTSAGFRLLPCVAAVGEVDRGRLPDLTGVQVGTRRDLDHVEAVTRRLRGAGHGPDIGFFLDEGANLLLADGGYAIFSDVRPLVLAAASESTAGTLLAAGLAAVPPGTAVDVTWMTGDQQWAIRTCVELGLELHPQGAVMVRGAPGPLAPYLPSGAFG